MKQSIFLKGFGFALVALPLAMGCKKKAAAPTEGSATSSAGSAGSATTIATGSGSVVADTGSGSATGSGAGAGSAASPTAPWVTDSEPVPASSKVTGRRDGKDEGTFNRAIYFKATDKYGSTSYELHLSTGCEKFSCSHYVVMNGGVYAGDKLSADCPGVKTMNITIKGEGDPKVGPVELDVSIMGPSSGGDLSGSLMKGSSLTAVSDKEVKGKIAVKDDQSEANGEFTAKNCGTIVIPKE